MTRKSRPGMTRPLILLTLPSLLGAASPQPDETVTLEAASVSAKSARSGAVAQSSEAATQYSVDPSGIELWAGAGGTNYYQALEGMPSVNVHAVDAFGLANIPGGSKGLRVRGELATHGVNGNIEGVPVNGVNPGPGQLFLYDSENYASVSLTQGPVPADTFSIFTNTGVMNTELLWPKAKRGLRFAQSLGSFNLSRSFLRYDSGTLANGSAFFLSGSHSQASKWRGPGDSPEGRNNMEAAFATRLGSQADFKVFAAFNKMKEDNYRALTYAQAMDLGTYRGFDYSDTSSATAAQAISYHGYNRQDFKDWSLLGEFTWRGGKDSKLVVKPFYQQEKGYYLDGMANGKVRDWLMDHDSYGLTAEFQTRFGETGLKVGYWWTTMVPPGPPTAWKMYTPTSTGDLSGGATWAILAKTVDRHQYHSAYAMADRSFGAMQLQAGLRYILETMPGLDFYNTTGIGDVSYHQALSQSTGVVAERSASSFSVHEALPFLGMTWDLNPINTLKFSLGRNYGAPAFDIWPVYQQNYATFHAQGVTADQLWHQMRPETSTAADFGLRSTFERGWLEPTLYYSRSHHKGVSYNPGLGVAYSQNVGESKAWGVQLAGNWSVLRQLELFGTLSYDRNEFASDLPLSSGGTLAVRGLQLPDVPLWSSRMGAAWHLGPCTLSPIVHYTGTRYGDTQHLQRVPGYATADLGISYARKLSRGEMQASLGVDNLLDKRYIGFINASYYQALSSTSAYYYPGAPRSVVGKLSLSF